MPQKPFFWLGVALIFFAMTLTSAFSSMPNFALAYLGLGWFSVAVAGILVKLNQVAERIENSAKLQTTAFRTLRNK